MSAGREWKEKVRANRAAGMDAKKAVAQAARDYPEIHQAMLSAANGGRACWTQPSIT